MAVDYKSISELAASFGRVPGTLTRLLRPKVLEGARLIQQSAQRNASWSTRIPEATTAEARFGARNAGATVRVDAAKAPHARPYEGITSGGNRGFFRHPTNDTPNTWVQEATRPFIRPAVEENEATVTALIAEAVRTATAHLKG